MSKTCYNWELLKGGRDWKTESKTKLKNGMENRTKNVKVVSNPY